jgi:uncharacterized membrane protein YhhN
MLRLNATQFESYLNARFAPSPAARRKFLGHSGLTIAAISFWQFETPHSDTGSWFLLATLAVLLIGGILLVVHGIVDLRRQHRAPEHTDHARGEKKKAA